MQYCNTSWVPGFLKETQTPPLGALDPSTVQRRSKGAQNGVFSSLYAWQELGHILMLVSRKYQEALSFLLHFYNSFIRFWPGFFYWIMTWGRSMRDSLQTTQSWCRLCQAVPARAVPVHQYVKHSTASYAGCLQQQSMNGALHAGVLCSQLGNLLYHPQRGQNASHGKLVPPFIWSHFKIQCRNYFAWWLQYPIRCASPLDSLLFHPEKFCFFTYLQLHQLIYLSLCPV